MKRRQSIILFSKSMFAICAAGSGLASIPSCSNPQPENNNNMWYPQPEMSEQEIYEGVKKLLQEGKTIELQWDCGGDEAIVSPTEKCKELAQTHNPLMRALDLYVINLLNLPDVGEFSMTGKGTLELVGEDVQITFESIMHGYEDYNEETKEVTFVEGDFVEPEYTGKKKMFAEAK